MQDYFKMLYNVGYKRFYNKDEILFFEGEMPKKLYVLLRGKVRIYKSANNGLKEQTLHYISAPSFIAEMPSFLKRPFPASAICYEECEILEVTLETFQKQCIENADFCYPFIVSLCQKIKILETHITKNSLSLKERLCVFLEENRDILESLTQREIAQKLNTSPESLSRILKELKRQGVIDTKRGKIIILHKE